MKYNISNLDEFKGNINPITDQIHDIAIMATNTIEDKIKELISPYICITEMVDKTIELIGQRKYKFGHIIHIDYEEYYIINAKNNSKDYFLTRSNVNLENCKSRITISEIVRGINEQ